MICIVLFAALLPTVVAHSWMSCPPSFNTQLGRGGIQGDNQCEGEWGTIAVTEVEAGDRLKIGWVSNNHGGGYARIALVPWGQHRSAANFKNNVMKFACYGHDTRPGKYQYGDCKHPCNGRPGCQYQARQTDDERYDTTIGIPTNLNGEYVLQLTMLVGNGGVYNSCAKLKIIGGNTGFNCQSSKAPVTYDCVKASGPPLSTIQSGTRRGNFCYGLDGSIGTVDDNMSDVPINVECDPRQTCGNSVDQGLCNRDFPTMSKIITPGSHPRQPNCRAFNVLPEF